jgi:hypothetical protein
MAVDTLVPILDALVGANWSLTGAASYSAALTDGLDTSYGSINASATVNFNLILNTAGLAPAAAIISATGTLRGVRAQKSNDPIVLALQKTGGGALLSSTSFALTQSISTITNSMTVADSTVADWSSPQLVISGPNNGNSDVLKAIEVSLAITYTPVSGFTRLVSDILSMHDSEKSLMLWRRLVSSNLGEHDQQAIISAIYARLLSNNLGIRDSEQVTMVFRRLLQDRATFKDVLIQTPLKPVFHLAPPGVVWTGGDDIWSLKP